VVFPPAVSIAEAKQYLYQELGELPVQAASASLFWTEEPGRVILNLGGRVPGGAAAVVLEAGVCERVAFVAEPREGNGSVTGTWQTCAVEFDRQAGWDRARAEEWVRRRVGLHDLGRTALLDVPHRMHAALAADGIIHPAMRVTLGTSRRRPETCEGMEEVRRRYGVDMGACVPERAAVQGVPADQPEPRQQSFDKQHRQSERR